MIKLCNNCRQGKSCPFRGIVNPCEDWQADASHSRLRSKAKQIVGKPMTMVEAQFVTSATTLEFFNPKQASWLRSIYSRVG